LRNGGEKIVFASVEYGDIVAVPGVITRTTSRETSFFAGARRFHLIADGDFESVADKARDVAVGGMIGTPRTWNGLTLFRLREVSVIWSSRGVPYHAADGYIARLIRNGFKIAICDQMESAGPRQKLVRREVVRVITPGTATDVAVLDARENNFLAAVSQDAAAATIGLAFVDLSTGEFQATEFRGPRAEEALREELQLLHPRGNTSPAPATTFRHRKNFSARRELAASKAVVEDWPFKTTTPRRILREQFGVAELTGFGSTITRKHSLPPAAIVHYLRENVAKTADATAQGALGHLDRVRYYEQHDALILDPVSVRNLELIAANFSPKSPAKTPLPSSPLSTSPSPVWVRVCYARAFASTHRSRSHRSAPRCPYRNSSSKPWSAAKFAKN